MSILPGLSLAFALAFTGQILSDLVGITWMGLPKSPVSAIMIAIVLGMVVRNLLPLPSNLDLGIRFGLVTVLRFGIVLLGIRLSLSEIGAIGLKSLPIIIGSVGAALLIASQLAKRLDVSGKIGTLIAVGTSICGATAIVAMAPTIAARDNEVSYSIACITLFGITVMLVYPFLGHWIFEGQALPIGLFLGTAVHETAQVAGAGLVYQQFYSDSEVLNIATVTKLVRNLGMLFVIPLMCILYRREHSDGGKLPAWHTMIPLFIVGFLAMSLLRTIGDLGEQPFGILDIHQWQWFVGHTQELAELCLGVAMAAVGLGTRFADLVAVGLKPMAIGLFSALMVGGVSITLITALY